MSGYEAYLKSKDLEQELGSAQHSKTRCFFNTSPTSIANGVGLIISGLGIFGSNKGKATNDVLKLIGPFISELGTTCNTTSLAAEIEYLKNNARTGNNTNSYGTRGESSPL